MDELRAALRAAADLAADHLSEVPAGPVWRPVDPADRALLTGQPLPSVGRDLDDVLVDLRRRVLPYPMGNGHPRFFGWVNSPPSSAGVMVAALAAAMNPSCAGGDHAGVLLERTAMRWLAELVGYPHSPGGGLLTSGASMATIIAVAAARHQAVAEQGRSIRDTGLYGCRPLVAYVSEEGHSCLRKAVELLGLGNQYLRVIPVDAGFRMDTAVLKERIAADQAAGLQPFLVAASAGTVNTGAIDPLERIAAIAHEHGMWFHIDGAYGALGVLADDPDPGFTGLPLADSLALDPHKWLGVPVDCGCILFRDPATPRDAFRLVPPYLQDDDADEPGWYSEYGPEQTRPFRALRLWATIAHLGRDGISRLVRRTMETARTLATMIDESDDFELLAPVTTTTVAFRYSSGAEDPRAVETQNENIPAAVQHRGHAFLTGTRLAGRAALRACVLNPATTAEDLSILLDEIRAAGEAAAP